jgi:hypothetical protein
MYSYEIENILRDNKHNIDSKTYVHICTTSPQISHVKYDPGQNRFSMYTDDNYHFNFVVHKNS